MKTQTNFDPRQELLQIFACALRAVEGRAAVRRWLQAQQVLEGPWRVVAIGKAASSMALGAMEALQDIEAGLLITKYGHTESALGTESNWHCIEAGHPYPDENSLLAGRELLAFIRAGTEETPLLFLISGGTSALVEVLPEGMTLAHLDALNHRLLHQSLDIGQINRVRQSLSCIKGGRLARYLDGRRAIQLLISDVPGDAAHVIGSGLLVAPPSTTGPPLDSAWLEFAARVPSSPEPHELGNVRTEIIANNEQARQAAAQAARERGWEVRLNEPMSGETHAASRHIARTLGEGEAGIYIWGGETHLALPPSPGHGGRCQSLALAVALAIQDCPNCWLLAVGTDGTDGPTEDAGALVESGTVAAGRRLGLDAGQALAAADAGTFLAQTGDLIHTGPTGTNVMDLCIGCKWPACTG